MAPAIPCPDCANPADGWFCGNCEVRLSDRLTATTPAGEFFARFFGAESGLWPTLASLTLAVPTLAGPALAGLTLAGLTLASPTLVGPQLAGPTLAGLTLRFGWRKRTGVAIATGLLVGFAGFLGSIVFPTGLAFDLRFWR